MKKLLFESYGTEDPADYINAAELRRDGQTSYLNYEASMVRDDDGVIVTIIDTRTQRYGTAKCYGNGIDTIEYAIHEAFYRLQSVAESFVERAGKAACVATAGGLLALASTAPQIDMPYENNFRHKEDWKERQREYYERRLKTFYDNHDWNALDDGCGYILDKRSTPSGYVMWVVTENGGTPKRIYVNEADFHFYDIDDFYDLKDNQ